MRVVVTGGRRYAFKETVFKTLDSLEINELAEGGAAGADRLAREWACERGVKTVCYPADWEEHGRSAGPIRNRRMLDDFKPDLVVAFRGGNGTLHCINEARHRGIEVLVVF